MKFARQNIVLLSRFFIILLFVVQYGCAKPVKQLPPPSPAFVYGNIEETRPAPGSLWTDRASLFEDRRARRLNDLITIKISENISGSNKADTVTDKSSTRDLGISSSGLESLYNADLISTDDDVSTSLSYSSTNSFDGSGETTQEGTLTGTITARVVSVQNNGNLVIDSRKEITINNEKQVLVLQGVIRPDDILADNTIISDKIADTRLYLVGDGIITEQQTSGWLGRMADQVWPF